MSLIRNQRNARNKSVTIKRFLSTEAFATHQFSREYVGLNNKYMAESSAHCVHFGTGCSIFIKAKFASDAEGPLFGATGNNLKIVADAGYVKWYKGTTLLHSVAIDNDTFHIYGFFFTIENDAYKYYPYYDDDKAGTAYSGTVATRAILLGGLSTDETHGTVTGDCIHSTTETYAIQIYEMAGYLLWRSTGGTNVYSMMDFYATSYSLNDTYPQMYDTLYNSELILYPSNGTAISGVTMAAGLGPHVTYGVQLHDLINAFGSGRKDLDALVCEDNGSPADDADPADLATAGSGGYYSAFRLADGQGTTITNPIPLPSGYNVSRSGTYNRNHYEVGELIYGRQPKWNIWSNGVHFGKYVKSTPDGLKLGFNIFKDYKGQYIKTKNSKPLFETLNFDGYNNSASVNYTPKIDWINGSQTTNRIAAEYHNTIGVKLDSSNRLIGGNKDNEAIFAYNLGAEGSAHFRIGNSVLWHVSASEQSSYHIYEIWKARVELHFAKDGAQSQDNVFLSFDAETPDKSGGVYTPFSSDSSATAKSQFRTNGIEAPALMNGETIDEMYHEFMLTTPVSGVRTLPMEPSMSLINTLDQVIAMDDFVSFQRLDIVGVFDNTVGTSTVSNDRFIVGEVGGTCKLSSVTYNFKKVTVGSKTYQVIDDDNEEALSSGTSYWHLLSNTQNDNPAITLRSSYRMVDVDGSPYHVGSNGLYTLNGETYTLVYPFSDETVTYTNADFDIFAGGETPSTSWENLFSRNIADGAYPGLGFVFTLQPHTSQSGHVGYTNKMVDFVANNITLYAYVECTFANTSTPAVANELPHVTATYFGFSTALPYSSAESIYFQDGYNPNSRATYLTKYMQPSEWYAVGDSTKHYFETTKDERCWVMWRWQDLEHLTGTVVYDNDKHRPNKGSLTAHVRLFESTTAPHAWDMLNKANSNYLASCGCPFVNVGVGTNKYYVIHNVGTLIDNSDSKTLLHAEMTAWSDVSNPIGNQIKSNFPSLKVSVYSEAITANALVAKTRTTLVDGVLLDNVGTTTRTKSVGDDIEISYKVSTCTDFITQPDGLFGRGLDYCLHVTVKFKNASAMTCTPGTMYYLEIKQPS